MANRRKRPKSPQRLDHVRWEHYSHRHLWNMIMDAHPNDVFGRHHRWVQLGRDLVKINEAVQGQLNSLFLSWQGTAAMSAALSNSRLLNWSQETAETTQRIGEELGRYGNALVEARRRMPQPRHVTAENEFRAGEGASVQGGAENAYMLLQLLSDYQATSRERTEAKERAIEVMRIFESEAVHVEQRLDNYAEAPNVVPPMPPGGPPPEWPGSDPDGSTGIDLPSGAGWPAPTGTAAAGAGGYGAGGYGASAGYGAGGYGALAGGQGGYAGQGGATGFPGGVAGGGVPGQAFGQGNRGPGGLPGQAEAAAGRGAVAPRGGTAGMVGRGGGMLYPPAAGARGDDDREKRVAPYLVEDEDLFDDDRTVAPPVFGA